MKKKLEPRTAATKVHSVNERLTAAVQQTPEEACRQLHTTDRGLTEEQAEQARDEFGTNVVTHGKKTPLLLRVLKSFADPFTGILILLVIVSVFTDIVIPPAGQKNPATVIIILSIILLSGIIRFVQETRSGGAAEKLSEMIRTTTCVERVENGRQEIPLDKVAVGDIVHLSAGDMIPADMRIIVAKDLFVSQSALTGESEPVEKYVCQTTGSQSITENPNAALMGTTVISGAARGVVCAVGNQTMLGSMAKELAAKPPKTSFEKGIDSVSWVLIRFMLVMVPIVLFINGFTKGDWMSALLFAISVAVGLTPEMLPMLVTTCLASGAMAMSKKKVIIKNLNSIQDLGSMDILCTDKTGTLTQDKVALEYNLNLQGQEDPRVLRHGFLNSYYQTGLKNLMDLAIIDRTRELEGNTPVLQGIAKNYTKVDEIPFDFDRRRMSVVVADKNGKTQMITKGAVEEMLSVSSFAEYEGKVVPLTEDMKAVVRSKIGELTAAGLRVIAVAQKTNPSPVGAFSVKDESSMVLIGYLAFLDPPKETARAAVAALQKYGVSVKVLTGDNDRVTCCVCRKVGIPTDKILLGEQIEQMSDDELKKRAEATSVFAKLTPTQKARIVRLLREDGHTVGYMGDGINDAAAMKASDVGISVDTAVDIAKESAHVILLEKDLMILKQGILEGRKTYGNMIKYIKMSSSSNFGNIFSVLVASAFLPFLPMRAVHLLLLNLLYDITCISLPWDNVDKEFLAKPRKWDASSIGRFMAWMGPTSSVFDIATYCILYFILCPAVCGGQTYRAITDPAVKTLFVSVFQTGWFVESMWTQTSVIHMIRTPKIPFVQSRASRPVMLMTAAGIAVVTLLPYTPLSALLGFTQLPAVYFAWLILVVVCYMLLATFAKNLYVRRYGELL
ncbi:MAG: magnesium-translocating P-type ATPase [Oscillospiraceae bacterium]|nr:magnesium-translocating P-type ATPase [Oscillospiraceae bacterium]